MKNTDFITPYVATCFEPTSDPFPYCPSNLAVVAYVEFVKAKYDCSYKKAVQDVSVTMSNWTQPKKRDKIVK